MNSAEDVAGLVAELNRQSRLIYLATDGSVAEHISTIFKRAVHLIESQAARLTEVESWVVHWQTKCQATRGLLQAAELALSTSHAERDRAVAALEPFASGSDIFFSDDPDDRTVSIGRWYGGGPLSQELPRFNADVALTVAHFRRAREVFRALTPAQETNR